MTQAQSTTRGGASPPDPDYDAIIVGGGPAGLTAALALGREDFRVCVIDATAPAEFLNAAFDGRVTAIAYAAARMLRRLGLSAALDQTAEPIRDILVTDGRPRNRFRPGAAASAFLHFDSRDLAEQNAGAPLGWIIENRDLRRALLDAVRNANIEILAPATVAAAARNGPSATATLSTGAVISAPLIIAADGRGSRLREGAMLKTVRWRYPQTGLVATVAHEHPHKGVAQEFFLPSGPFAILPMTENRSSLVWTEDTALAQSYVSLPDAEFDAAIADRFGPYLGATRAAGPRWSYPLSFHVAQSFIAPRLALLGDAAHGIHPIAGQGFNLGLKDIAALAQTLREARALGLDIGQMNALAPYQRWRRFDVASMAFGTDALNRLFSNDLTPVRMARDLGLAAVNAVAPLKRLLMRSAGGDVGELPELMRP